MLSVGAHRRSLPIFPHKERIQAAVRAHPCVVIVGEPGSGKTTQIPQYLHESGDYVGGAIGCTQPRRVAAVTVARRVAEEAHSAVGKKVGYSVRFDDQTSPETEIKYLTDGMLVQESIRDPILSQYKVILVDEAHERSLQTDTVLGLLKKIQSCRADVLHVVVMSATLDCGEILGFFPAAKCLYVRGRQFPVQLLHLPNAEESYLDAVLHCALQIHLDEEDGDVLVFLTGEEEIESMAALIRSSFSRLPSEAQKKSLLVLTLYAAMSPDKQLKVFSAPPEGSRRVILATNIAETSVTIPGIRFVIDTGVVKQRFYHAQSGVDALRVVPISKAQAKQRSGRAGPVSHQPIELTIQDAPVGRQSAGKAFRLYTAESYHALQEHAEPEIARTNLAEVVLKLKAMGIDDVLRFDFISPPPRPALLRSLELLHILGALDDDGHLTDPMGKWMSRLPLDPSLGRVLIAAMETGCGDDMLSIVSMISATNIFYDPRDADTDVSEVRHKFTSRLGDHLTLLNVFRAYVEVGGRDRKSWCTKNFVNFRSMLKAENIRKQLKQRCVELGFYAKVAGEVDVVAIQKALINGFFFNVARRQDNRTYRMLSSGQELKIHPSSAMFERKSAFVLFSEIIQTNKVYARQVSAVDPRWLPEVAPMAFQSGP